MTLRPGKWIIYSPIAALPFIAAWALNGQSLQQDLANRAGEALKGAGADWAKLTIDGRDAAIAGDSRTQEAIDAAVQAVAHVHGIRRVDSAARVVKVEILPPTINAVSADVGPITVTGSWQEGDAAGLRASLAGKSWEFGKDEALTSDGKGNWTLKPDVDLAPGAYDLVVEAIDVDGKAVADTSKDEITIKAPLPDLVAPTVTSIITNKTTPEIKGTWPSAVATAMTVTVGAAQYILGKATELTTDNDTWTLVPSAPLADGTLDVTVEVTDAAGRVAKTAAPGKLTIDTVAPVLPVIGPIEYSGNAVSASGTWAEGDAVSLVAKLADKAWTFGKDAALTSDGKGNWSFKPDIELQPGTYDLGIEITDAAGNVARDTTKDEIVVAGKEAPPPGPVMAVPTVMAASETVARPVIHGTWSEAAAKSLSVTVAGKTYVFGSDAALTSDGIGNWSLGLEAPLADGTYDVAVETADAAGNKLTDASKDELVIDAQGPATPQVMLYSGTASPDHLSGSWDEANAASLLVAIPAANISAALGKDAALTSDAGKWKLVISQVLAPGSYDVVVETADKMGRIARDQTKFELLVKEPPPPLPDLKLPTVATYAGVETPGVVTGTWDEGVANALSVAIPGAKIAAKLGTDQALASDGKGNWSLTLFGKLSPGTYDVAVTESDANNRSASDATTAEIYIKNPPPLPDLKLPTVATYAGVETPGAITGSWDEGTANALSVAIPGAKIAAKLGSDKALTSDGKGNWSLALFGKLSPGTYDVAVTESDANNRSASDTTTAEIYIKPPPPPPPYDCAGAIDKISSVFPIRFAFGMADLQSPYDLAVNQYAALLKDPRCLETKALITGHADYYGGRLFNRAISVARAHAVMDILVQDGVAPARLEVDGRGKADPVDPAHNKDARSKNRRVVITIVK